VVIVAMMDEASMVSVAVGLAVTTTVIVAA
jgi:hypothetical protein